MKTAKLFQDGCNQAVLLPEEFRFKGKNVYIKKIGNAVVLMPTKNAWEPLFNSLHKFSDDYMESRGHSKQQCREDIF